MKRILTLVFTSICILSYAQDGINYQGAATDSNGDALVNQSISLKTSILSGTATGTIVFSETHSTTTDQFGLFNVVIGQGNSISGIFDDIDWGANNHFLQVELDENGGSNYTMIATTQMMSVPYALYAKNSGLDSSVVSNMIGTALDTLNISQENDEEIQSGGASNDFNNEIESSDFNSNVISEIPQSLNNKEIILFSTNKSIYITDSVGSFTDKIYSVNSDYIYSLTSNDTGDTLYFLQASTENSPLSIMMFTTNNLNVTSIGSIPLTGNDIYKFKYKNGAFFYLRGNSLMKYQNG